MIVNTMQRHHPKFQFCNTELLLWGGYGLTPVMMKQERVVLKLKDL